MKTPSVCFTRSRWMCAVILAVTLCAPRLASAATTIYSDDFSGLSTVALDGTTPDVRSGTLGGSASATWIADTLSYMANGTAIGQGAPNIRYAFLAFTPVVGNVYTLTVDLNTANATSVNWLGAGFTSNTSTSTSSNALDTAWVSYAANGLGKVYGSSATPYTTFGAAGSASDPITLTITLDTTTTLWKTTYSAYDLSTSLPLGSGSYTYTTNPTITSVFIGDIIYGGTVDNFSLTAAPEPNSIALLGMAILVSGSLIRLRAARARGALA